MEQFGKINDRHYKPCQYIDAADAANRVVRIGAGCDPTQEHIETHPNCNVGLLKIHLHIPFSVEMINKVIPSSAKRICVMDKHSDPTAAREPLFTDVASAVIRKRNVETIGDHYGISSKDFAPPHVEAIIKNLDKPHTSDRFTLGVASQETSLPIGKSFDFLPAGTEQCIFWGLGSDVIAGTNK